MKFGLLIDTTKCIGCHGCTLACKEANDLPSDDDGKGLSATTWTTVEDRNGVHVRKQCMHCEDPACASVCPVGALRKTDVGPVVYDETKCIGCRYCMVACPFGIPRYEWNKPVPRMRKCIMCYENAVKHGKPTACASVCPTGATLFGERAALLTEAERRLREEPARYWQQIYGAREAGGTSVLYLAGQDFAKLGFKTTLRTEAYPQLTWSVLSRLPNVVSVAGVGLAGVWWIMNRRDEVASAEEPKTKKKHDPEISIPAGKGEEKP
jgi:formate dehydrogenase iron-sulfur subunit